MIMSVGFKPVSSTGIHSHLRLFAASLSNNSVSALAKKREKISFGLKVD